MGFSRQEYWSGVPLPSPKIRDTKGIFHAKIGTIKDKNDTDLIQAVKIKKRW